MSSSGGIVGRRVVPVHRDDPLSDPGTIVGVLEGVNALVRVEFDARRGSPSIMVPGDLAFLELYPREGCRVAVPAHGTSSTSSPPSRRSGSS